MLADHPVDDEPADAAIAGAGLPYALHLVVAGSAGGAGNRLALIIAQRQRMLDELRTGKQAPAEPPGIVR